MSESLQSDIMSSAAPKKCIDEHLSDDMAILDDGEIIFKTHMAPPVPINNKGKIDLRKESEIEEYKIIIGYIDNACEVQNFNKQCNDLRKLGWVPLYPPTTSSTRASAGYVQICQQWIKYVIVYE
jgi:hypothetical protein